MAQAQIDTRTVAKTFEARIRAAAQPTLNESRLVKTAALNAQRQRVAGEVARISAELAQLASADKDRVTEVLAELFGLARPQLEGLFKEASVSGILAVGGYWGDFFTAIGL